MRMFIRALQASLPGFLIAFAAPILGLAVAFLWDRQVLDLKTMRTDPALAVFWGELILGPVGLAIAARAGLRTYLGRVFLVFPILPVVVLLVVLEFVAVLALSSLGGAPF